ncbi:MAG TPA: hypothetical protein VMN78_01175 [Longimicrobiales bacterium]|nr:hypothetical protein [Longimicrobiales bacterium]
MSSIDSTTTPSSADGSVPGGARLPPGIDRRGFLRSTAGGGVAIGLAALLPGCGREASAGAAAAGELRSLTGKEFEVARAAAEALLVGVPIDPSAIATRLDYELWAVGGAIEEDVRTVLQLLEHLTPLGGRLRRFTELNPTERLAYLETWRNSRFNLRRASFNAIKSFVYFFAYADPAMWAATGFPGTWPGRIPVGIPPIDFGEVV